MPKKKRPVSYEELKKIWYDKLKKSGFKDIEYDEDWMQSCLPRPDALINNSLYRETTQEYYSMASKLLHEHEFKDKTEKTIWDLYTQGMSPRKIAKKLYPRAVEGRYKQIWKKIKKLETVMKEKYLVNR